MLDNRRAGGHTVLTHTAGENEAELYSRLRHYALGMQWSFFTLDWQVHSGINV